MGRGVRRIEFNLANLYDPEEVSTELDPTNQDYHRRVALGRKEVTRGNMASFYAHLYTGIFGGRVSEKFQRRIMLLNGNHRNYSPDVIHRRGRQADIEVKSFSTREGKVPCSIPQFENYAFNMLQENESVEMKGLDSSFDFNYAFFRFKVPVKTKSINGKRLSNGRKRRRRMGVWKPESMHPEELIDKMSQSIQDVLVVPSNLAMLLFMNSNRYENQGKELDREDWHAGSGDITALHDPDRGIEALIDNYQHRAGFSEFLGTLRRGYWRLDDLEAHQSESPTIKVNGHFEAPPMRVTQYEFINKEAQAGWIANMRRYHRAFLEDSLEVRDVFAEDKRESRKLGRRKVYTPPDDGIPI